MSHLQPEPPETDNSKPLGLTNSSPAFRRSRYCAALVFALLTVQRVLAAGDADPRAQNPRTTGGPPVAQTYVLRVTTNDGVTGVSIEAEGARLSEIVRELSRRLNTEGFVGQSLQEERVFLRFADSPLEVALGSLAPRVYIDYEIRQGASPTPKGIYFLGLSDPDPPTDAVVKGPSQGVVIEGNTDDPPKKPEDDPLRVALGKTGLTIAVKAQPLSLVLRAIGDVLGVPVDLNGDASETVDADMRDLTPQYAIPRLSPNIRMYVRVDVNRLVTTPLRIMVVRPDLR